MVAQPHALSQDVFALRNREEGGVPAQKVIRSQGVSQSEQGLVDACPALPGRTPSKQIEVLGEIAEDLLGPRVGKIEIKQRRTAHVAGCPRRKLIRRVRW